MLRLHLTTQVRGFWLGPWLQEESGDPQRVLRDVMGLLADGTIVPEAGVRPPIVWATVASCIIVNSRAAADAQTTGRADS